MKSDRAERLDKLRLAASSPNCDSYRLNEISRGANDTKLGRPTRDYLVSQLKEIESRNRSNSDVMTQITDIRERFIHAKGVKARRLERQARAAAAETTPTAESTESIPTRQPESDDEFAMEYPPLHLLWPPDPSVYTPGWFEAKAATRRLIAGGAKDLNPKPSRPDICERVIRTALGPTYSYAELTLELLQRLWLALQGYEPRLEDPMMVGDRHRFWVWERLFASVFYLATAKHGYGSLHDPPPNPSYVRDLLKQESESSYVKLEALPRAIAAARLYRHLPGFNELLTEIEGGNHV